MAVFPILFVAPADTREALVASGLIRVLGEEIPDARFTLVVARAAAPLFSGLETLDDLIVIDDANPAKVRTELKPQVRHTPWGLTVDLRQTGIADQIRSLRRAVFKPQRAQVHPAEAFASLFQLHPPPDPILFPYPEADERARQITAGEGPILAMAPLTPWMGSAWPLERYNLIAMRLLAPGGELEGGRLAVIGAGGTDPRQADPLTRAISRDRVIDLVSETDLGLIAATLQRADLFIGGDTLIAHIAAAAGARTLTLFGPSDESLAAPLSSRARTVRGPRSFEQIAAVDRGLNQSISHMMDLSAEAVTEAIRALLTETQRLPPLAEASHG
jgi:ADP-heptose:LPS heptosyltransferase